MVQLSASEQSLAVRSCSWSEHDKYGSWCLKALKLRMWLIIRERRCRYGVVGLSKVEPVKEIWIRYEAVLDLKAGPKRL